MLINWLDPLIGQLPDPVASMALGDPFSYEASLPNRIRKVILERIGLNEARAYIRSETGVHAVDEQEIKQLVLNVLSNEVKALQA